MKKKETSVAKGEEKKERTANLRKECGEKKLYQVYMVSN